MYKLDIKEFMLFGVNGVNITLIELPGSRGSPDQSRRPGKGAKVADCFHSTTKAQVPM